MEYRSGLTRVLGSSRWLVAAGAVAACLFAASPAHANLVTNGSFESGVNPPTGPFSTLGGGSTDITGWTVTGDSIDWIDQYWTAFDGLRSIDLTGGGPGPGGMTTTFASDPGQSYRLSFALAGNPAGAPTVKSLDVTVDGVLLPTYTFNTSGTTLTSMGWVTYTYDFTATSGSTTLSFDSLDPGFFGPALDNVDVEAVPEPATLMLLGAGLSALGIVRRRKA